MVVPCTRMDNEVFAPFVVMMYVRMFVLIVFRSLKQTMRMYTRFEEEKTNMLDAF